MAWLLINDEIDYTSVFYPTHVVSKDKKLLPVFVGAPQTMIRGLVGLYIKDGDYHDIRHDKAYIFIHNPDATDDDLEDIDWEKIPDAKNERTVGRDHIHLWNEPEFEGGK